MIARLLAACARRPLVVFAAAAVAAVAGARAWRAIPRAAIPELADPRIAVVAQWTGHPATEVSSHVTEGLTAALAAVPDVEAVRGTSMTGMAFVEVVFRSAAALDRRRVEIAGRIERARAGLPGGVGLSIGPSAASTGWVFQYALVERRGLVPAADLRRLHEKLVRPALAAVPGIAEIATVGGSEEIVVEAIPERLAAAGLASSDLVAPLQNAAGPAAGRTDLAGSVERIAGTAVARGTGAEGIRIGDVARVRPGPDMHFGIANLDGSSSTVGGIVIARPEADPSLVTEAVKQALDRLRPTLPSRISLVTVYDRSQLAQRVETTLVRALGEEIAVVVVILLVFLMHLRSGLIPLVTLPLVLLLTFAGMWLCGIDATVMSLGGIAIALGLAVDADLVALESCHRRLEADATGGGGAGSDRRGRLLAAASSITPAIVTSLLISALTFLPVLAFTGETGRLLRPLALTKALVIVSAVLVTLTVGPALRDRLLGGRVVAEMANPITRLLIRLYRPFVHFALERPVATLVLAALTLVSCVPLVSRLGEEYLPRLDEGDLLFMPTTLPGLMPRDAEMALENQNRILARFPEVAAVFGKAGRADTATDPAPLSMVETTVHLKPRSEWPLRPRLRWHSEIAPPFLRRFLARAWPEMGPATTSELTAMLDHATAMPGWSSAWTTPARARMDMMSTGVRTPIGVRIVGSNHARLAVAAAAVRTVVARLPGTRGVAEEAAGAQASLSFEVDPGAVALFGADDAAVRAMAALVVADGEVTSIVAGGTRVPIRLRVSTPSQRAVDRLRETTVRVGAQPGARGQVIPLALLGRPTFVDRPAVSRTERGELVTYVHVDLEEGIDLTGYLTRARQAVEAARASGEIALLAGERIEWTGQYELLAAGKKRLRLIVPLVILSMFVLLYLQVRSLTETLIVLCSVPFALVGSIWTLWAAGYSLSAPVWVGLLSVMGLAMQTGVVMVVYIDQAFHGRVRAGLMRSRSDIVAAHAEGSIRRLRPKIMTVTTMGFALLPLVWADGAGAEIMRRVAAPMLGGLLSSAFLTLEILPVLYTIWRHRQLRFAERTGRPIAAVVGPPPPWARA